MAAESETVGKSMLTVAQGMLCVCGGQWQYVIWQ